MNIIAALFIDSIDTRQVPGPSTRIDLSGIQFSAPAPSEPPFTVEPHLVVIVHCPPDPALDGHARGRLPSATASRSPATCSRSRSSRASSTTDWSGPSSSSPSWAPSKPIAGWIWAPSPWSPTRCSRRWTDRATGRDIPGPAPLSTEVGWRRRAKETT